MNNEHSHEKKAIIKKFTFSSEEDQQNVEILIDEVCL